MSENNIPSLLDKINLLFNVFMKDGLEKVSPLERDLLKEQIQKLLVELDKMGETSLKPSENKPEDSIKTTVLEFVKEQDITEIQPTIAAALSVQNVIEPEVFVEEETPIVSETIQSNSIESAPVELIKSEEEAEKAMIVPPVTKEKDINQEQRVFSTLPPTRSLKEIIDLNKSFILRAELFSNNNEAYMQFVNELNALQSEEASFQFIEQIAVEKKWDKEEKVFELLIRAVEKRFLPLLQS